MAFLTGDWEGGSLDAEVTSFDDFMADRQKQLLDLIERATGKAAYSGDQPEEGEDVEGDEDTIEAELTISGE